MQVRVFMDDAQNPRFITIGQALKTTGIKDGDAVEALDFASRELSYSTFPIYLRILIGIGSLIVAGLLFLALTFFEVLEIEWARLLLGGVLIAFGVLLYRGADKWPVDSYQYSVFLQLSFVGALMGKILFISGVYDILPWDESVNSFLASLVVTLATYWIYDLYVDRILSSSTTIWTFIYMLPDLLPGGYDEFLVRAFVYLMVPIGTYLFLSPTIHPRYKPLAMAFLFAAGWHVLDLMMHHGFGASNWPELSDLWIGIAWNLTDLWLSIICTFINALTLVYLIIWGSGGWDNIVNKKVKLAIGMVVALSMLGLASCLVALVIVAIGFLANDRLILGAGVGYLSIALFVATHSLEAGLMATGLVLILMSMVLWMFYLKTAVWFRCVESEMSV